MNEPASQPYRVLIVGAGWIGRQVALRMATRGIPVWICDRDKLVSDDALIWMDAHAHAYAPTINTQTLTHGERDPQAAESWRTNVTPLESLAAAPPCINIVLECVTEQVSLKKRVLKEISQRFAAPLIIASNSSYFTPSMLCRYVEDDSRFAHLHFHAPLYRDTIADIAGCPNTRAEVLIALQELAGAMGHQSLVLRREHPGYVFNWMLQSLLRSALELACEGVADPVDIDRSWKAVSGMPLGPFGMMDEIGIDVIYQVLSNARWANPSPVTLEQMLEALKEKIDQGALGVKTNRGFYEY